jgi:hypothetical protein
VEKEKEALRMELTKSKAQIQEADEAIAGQKAQLEKLNHVVAEADAGECQNVLSTSCHMVKHPKVAHSRQWWLLFAGYLVAIQCLRGVLD